MSIVYMLLVIVCAVPLLTSVLTVCLLFVIGLVDTADDRRD